MPTITVCWGLWKPHVRISQENGKVVCLLLHLAIVLLPSAILADRLERSSSHESRGQGADEEMGKRSWKMCQAAYGEVGNDKIQGGNPSFKHVSDI